jgi:F420-non-reducing hydrogenase small subunit
MSERITVATTWLQSCSGCHMATLDLHAELFDLIELIDIKYSTIADIKEVPEVDLALVEGAVANEDNAELLRTFRQQAKTLVALGTCACFGGVPGLRNLFERDAVLRRGYVDTESTVDGKIPAGKDIPELMESVKPIDQLVKVDHYLPGCPPLPSAIQRTIVALAKGEKPPLPTRNLCEECDRKKSKMLVPSRDFVTTTVLAPNELEIIDPEQCFLEQGVLCMGPATREGCGSRCLGGNMPCRGCMGPTPDALEQGAKMVNALASILPAGALMFNEDVVGVGYRYSMAVSIFPELAKGKG